MRHKTLAATLAGLLILALIGWGVGSRWLSVHAAAPAAPPIIPVTAGTADARDMPVYARGIGTIQAYNSVAVKSRVDGQIVKVDFNEGQEVKAGDPLFEIDPRPYQAALAQAEAAKTRDEAQQASASADLQRTTTLLKQGFQTPQAYDQQKATVGQLGGSIQVDEAQIEAAQINLDYATIRSPIDGRTGAKLVDVGNLVHATDSNALVNITQLKPIFASFTVPEGELDAIRSGQAKAPLVALAFTGDDTKQLAEGKLSLIDNQVDQTTGTIHLKAEFSNEDEKLWPGQFVEMRLVLETNKNAVTVPAHAILQGPDGPYLFVIKPDSTVEIRKVNVAETEDGRTAISKGLAAGERIVVDGQYRLEQGTKVSIQTSPAPTS